MDLYNFLFFIYLFIFNIYFNLILKIIIKNVEYELLDEDEQDVVMDTVLMLRWFVYVLGY